MAARTIGEAAAERILARKEKLARTITERLYESMPELLEKHGEYGRAKCLQDMRYNLEHLAPAVALDESPLFTRYVVWLRDMLQSRGVQSAEVLRSLRITREIALESLPPGEGEAVARVVQEGVHVLEAGEPS